MRRLLILGIVLVPAAAGAALFFLLRPSVVPGVELRTVLPSLDAAISGGYLSTARETLSSLRGLPDAEPDQLSLLKRAFLVSRGTGEFTLLAGLAERALARHGQSRRLRAIGAYGDLRAGRVAEAEKILGRAAAAGKEGETLRGEALLRRGGRWSGSDELTRELLALDGMESSAAFAAAALRAGDKRLALDAALLAMEQGSRDSALRLVREELGDSRFDGEAGLMLYDAGAVQEALLRARRKDIETPGLPALGFLLADMYSFLGNDSQAEEQLLKTLPRAPGLTWTPYSNLALFALDRRQGEAAVRRLQDGLAFFPRSRELRLTLARVQVRRGDTPAAESLLAGLLADGPADGEAALLLLSLQSPGMSPEALRARLWKLFDLAPADAAVFDTLASSLIAARDWEGMKIAVRQHEAAGGQPDARLLEFQGLGAAMSGDDAGAVASFRQAAVLAKDGAARFNLALVMLRRGGARAALTELDAALEEASGHAPPADRASLVSRIETLRGEARLLDGDLQGAGSALSRALALDPHNLRAGLLLRKLEAAQR